MIHPEAYIHPLAVAEQGASIGRLSRIWQFCVILPGAVIGEDCNICSHCLIEGEARVGSRVTVKCGVQLWDGVTLEDDVFVGPNATFTNDPRPRSRNRSFLAATTVVEAGASIGANATVLPGLRIGRGAMVAAGALATHDVPAFAVVRGNPARLAGWVCWCGQKLDFESTSIACACGRRFEKLSETSIMERS
jgi:UDP-2-acetamido-3-amino-2,3-dideoxy-glucuronate N-acetyltransferase